MAHDQWILALMVVGCVVCAVVAVILGGLLLVGARGLMRKGRGATN